ncbi:hypothetical protein ScPMuIL_018988 [Solemya velum]
MRSGLSRSKKLTSDIAGTKLTEFQDGKSAPSQESLLQKCLSAVFQVSCYCRLSCWSLGGEESGQDSGGTGTKLIGGYCPSDNLEVSVIL